MGELKIRCAKDSEVESFVSFGLEEGWNMSLKELPTYFRSYPEAWLVAEMDGVIVGRMYSTKYPSGRGHIGYLIVKKEERGKGVGTALLRHTLEIILKDCDAVGLYTGQEEVSFYKKLGFRVEANVLRMSRIMSLPQQIRKLGDHQKVKTFGMTPQLMEEVSKYDAQVSGSYRPEFWKLFLTLLPPSHCCICKEKNEIVGVGAIRPFAKSTRIGPIYTENKGIAKLILQRLLEEADENKETVVDIFEENLEALELMESFGFCKKFDVFSLIKSSGHEVDIKKNKDIFCINSLDFN